MVFVFSVTTTTQQEVDAFTTWLKQFSQSYQKTEADCSEAMSWRFCENMKANVTSSKWTGNEVLKYIYKKKAS